MIDGLKPYPAYRESGVQWLGKIPEHWDVRRLKYILRQRDSRSATGTEQLLRVSQYTGVTQRLRADGGDEPDTRAESLVGYKLVAPDDLAVNIMLAWNGSMGVSKFPGIVSPAYCVYRFGPVAHPWYFHYLLRSPTYKALIKAVSTGVVESRLRLYTDDLYRLEALLPPCDEQAAVVRFLDHVDRRIRRYIWAKRKLIALLNEQKQAIIHRAVTRGLDPNIRLKPSGVEWLGDAPEHWNVLPLRRIVTKGRHITYGIVQPGEPDPNGKYMIRGKDYSDGWADGASIFRVSDAIEGPYRRSRLRPGDIVITIVGAGVGNVAVVPEWLDGANITQTSARISPDCSKVLPAYVALALSGPLGKRNVDQYVYGAAQPRLNLPHVGAFLLPVPPTTEQAQIVDTLTDRLSAIAQATTRASSEVRLMREYRIRLIADVITGTLDVREAAARLPNEVDEGDAVADELIEGEDVIDGAELDAEKEEVENA